MSASVLELLLLLALIQSFDMKCKPTSSDIYGPFYYSGSPRLKRFCKYKRNDSFYKVPLHVFGRVFACDCKTLLQRVKVEMWQANHEGEYKNNTKCRGFVRTNKHGFYELVTIYPGKYSTSVDGRDLRPAHLHFKINGRKGHKSLVTQMYFDGDEHLGHIDPCTSCSSKKRDLMTKPKRMCGFNGKKRHYCVDSVEFNITLAKGKGLHVSPVEDEGDNNVC